mmetsp:Transcript_67/g.123  ORF Transcript_67/g.123 Transcript_67/m.123 type:complete len:81 (-) Transcript_67:260-502(-)
MKWITDLIQRSKESPETQHENFRVTVEMVLNSAADRKKERDLPDPMNSIQNTLTATSSAHNKSEIQYEGPYSQMLKKMKQ